MEEHKIDEALRNKPIFMMTGSEFLNLCTYGFGLAARGDEDCEHPNAKKRVDKHYLYGLQGLADFLGCTVQTASNIKNSGALDPAIGQIGNCIVIDRDLCFDLIIVKKTAAKRNRRKK